MDKKEIRRLIFERRKTFSDTEILNKSREVFKTVMAAPEYQKASCVFVYMDMRHEVMTGEFIRKCMTDGKIIAVPKVNGKQMNFYQIRSFSQLKSGVMGIMEPDPQQCILADGQEDSLIIVPGVAFDPACNRIGYGGGYYDRYLNSHKEHETIAVAFEFQILDGLPHDVLDIRPDRIITERRMILKK